MLTVVKYRIYIDETGDHNLENCEQLPHRFLGLTGAIFSLQDAREKLVPRLEQFKRTHLPYDPDEPPILHRKEIINKRYPFHVLHDPEKKNAFNADLLRLLEELEYVVVTVVLDKLEHKTKYTTWLYLPYHYCLQILLERFTRYLESKGAIGDALAESRGGTEDRKLKGSYSRLYKGGTDFISAERFQTSLTSCQLKLKPKRNNIAGLQLADLLAYPSKQDVLRRNNLIPKGANVFGDKILKLLEKSKYYRGRSGEIDGYGRKLLP